MSTDWRSAGNSPNLLKTHTPILAFVLGVRQNAGAVTRDGSQGGAVPEASASGWSSVYGARSGIGEAQGLNKTIHGMLRGAQAYKKRTQRDRYLGSSAKSSLKASWSVSGFYRRHRHLLNIFQIRHQDLNLLGPFVGDHFVPVCSAPRRRSTPAAGWMGSKRWAAGVFRALRVSAGISPRAQAVARLGCGVLVLLAS
jgi:hypothetical protein